MYDVDAYIYIYAVFGMELPLYIFNIPGSKLDVSFSSENSKMKAKVIFKLRTRRTYVFFYENAITLTEKVFWLCTSLFVLLCSLPNRISTIKKMSLLLIYSSFSSYIIFVFSQRNVVKCTTDIDSPFDVESPIRRCTVRVFSSFTLPFTDINSPRHFKSNKPQ